MAEKPRIQRCPEAELPENFFVNYQDFKGPDNMWFTSDDGLALSFLSSAIDSGSTAHLFDSAVEYNDFIESGKIT